MHTGCGDIWLHQICGQVIIIYTLLFLYLYTFQRESSTFACTQQDKYLYSLNVTYVMSTTHNRFWSQQKQITIKAWPALKVCGEGNSVHIHLENNANGTDKRLNVLGSKDDIVYKTLWSPFCLRQWEEGEGEEGGGDGCANRLLSVDR